MLPLDSLLLYSSPLSYPSVFISPVYSLFLFFITQHPLGPDTLSLAMKAEAQRANGRLMYHGDMAEQGAAAFAVLIVTDLKKGDLEIYKAALGFDIIRYTAMW